MDIHCMMAFLVVILLFGLNGLENSDNNGIKNRVIFYFIDFIKNIYPHLTNHKTLISSDLI